MFNNRFGWIILSLFLIGIVVFGFRYFSKNIEGNSVTSKIIQTSKLTDDSPVLEYGQVAQDKSINTYSHDLLGFSFEYTNTFSISSFGSPFDETGNTILIQTNDAKNGLQILISPFDEDIILTEKRIKKDLPNLDIINAKEVDVGSGKNIQGVQFESKNSSMGKSLELWFVYQKELYQISSPMETKDLFDSVIKYWKWK